MKFSAVMKDVPGSLKKFSEIIAIAAQISSWCSTTG